MEKLLNQLDKIIDQMIDMGQISEVGEFMKIKVDLLKIMPPISVNHQDIMTRKAFEESRLFTDELVKSFKHESYQDFITWYIKQCLLYR